MAMTRKEYLRIAAQSLTPRYGDREARSIASLIAESITGIGIAQAAMEPDAQIPQGKIDKMLDAVRQVAAGRPVQYVLGKGWFCGREFSVGEGALIPRGETEELVMWIISSHGRQDNLSILDIGTGSGAIAITLAIDMPSANVAAIDISGQALDIARRNAEAMGATVEFIKTDILKTVPGQDYDIIVSNPPYIPISEAGAMQENVVAHEPHTALFVPDGDPLLFYSAIASHCLAGMLRQGGWLYFEVHENYAAQVYDMLSGKGFMNIEPKEDIHSKPRMVRCRRA